jgi:hypothetical protein
MENARRLNQQLGRNSERDYYGVKVSTACVSGRGIAEAVGEAETDQGRRSRVRGLCFSVCIVNFLVMNSFTISFLILIAVIIVNRMISENALKRLTADEKAKLIDSFSGYRQYNTYLIFGLVAAYLVTTNYLPHFYGPLTLGYVGLFLVISVILTIVSYSKLRRLEMPPNYVRSYCTRLVIQYIGVAAIFVPIAWNAFKITAY